VITWFQSLSPAHAAIALILLFWLALALYLAAAEWRRRVIARRQRRCLRVNRDYRRSIRRATPHHSARRNGTAAPGVFQ
jgi:hypothetical protein